MEQLIVFFSLLGWGLLLFFFRPFTVLYGDFAHRLEYKLRGSQRPPFGLICLIVLSLLDTLLLLYFGLSVGGLDVWAATSTIGLISLVLLWIALGWGDWRQGWLESMIEQPQCFWPGFEKLLWLFCAIGLIMMLCGFAVLRDFFVHNAAIALS